MKKERVIMLIKESIKKRAVIIGQDSIRKAIRKGDNILVLMTYDISDATKSDMIKRCKIKDIRYIVLDNISKEYLAKNMGKRIISMLAIKDPEVILKLLDLSRQEGDSIEQEEKGL
jgi:ribosomal protein L7Ae-like RNA K-turn-binding protein